MKDPWLWRKMVKINRKLTSIGTGKQKFSNLREFAD